MIEAIEICLRGAISDELYEAVDSAVDVMDRAGISDYVTPFEEILAAGDELDVGEPQRAMVALVNGYMDALLLQHEIKLVPDAPLHLKSAIVEGLLDLPGYEDHDAVVSYAQASEDTVEAISMVLSLVTPYQTDQLMPWFDQVSWALIRRICEVHPVDSDVIDIDIDALTGTEHLRDLLIELWIVLGRPENPLMQYIGNGLPLGLQFTIYASMFKSYFEQASPSGAAMLFMLISRISEEGQGVLLDPIRENIDLYIQDQNAITSIDVYLRDYFIRYTQHVEARLLSERTQNQ